MEGTETLCTHATILNHRWVPGTRSRLLSVKPDEWMHLSPIHTRVHGEWLRYAKSTSQWRFLLVRDDWGFQVNPLCRHDITSPFPPSGNEGYIRNRDVIYCICTSLYCKCPVVLHCTAVLLLLNFNVLQLFFVRVGIKQCFSEDSVFSWRTPTTTH